ncbi:hypothetical protein LX36DRAFT_707078 [Colletotrichum falcatum]|nr:hypothetical protein LX36DRAFT_707078 [Colletotrichum falcatum]
MAYPLSEVLVEKLRDRRGRAERRPQEAKDPGQAIETASAAGASCVRNGRMAVSVGPRLANGALICSGTVDRRDWESVQDPASVNVTDRNEDEGGATVEVLGRQMRRRMMIQAVGTRVDKMGWTKEGLGRVCWYSTARPHDGVIVETMGR